MDCQICLETFDNDRIYTVLCGSPVGHNICIDCEDTWRFNQRCSNQAMTCPTCRGPELERTNESLLREADRVNKDLLIMQQCETVVQELRELTRQFGYESVRSEVQACSSGRVCPNRQRITKK